MKRIFLFAVCLLLISQTAFAHPPTDIAIIYDKGTKMLEVVITHPVSNSEKHYIKKVDTAINGVEVIEQKISRQDNGTAQRAWYYIPDVKDGDVISVEGYCSIHGKLKKEITIEM